MEEEAREAIGAVERHEAQEPEGFGNSSSWLKRIWIAFGVLTALTALVLVPPLINVNRYRRQISSSIAASLGRQVHLDTVSLNVLPLPGFTIQNFVVMEDPAFGAEPTIRADSVRATLRIRSLWRRRVEFSKIALTDPSVNIVHLPDGRWNLGSILLQASRMPAAPTIQREIGSTQRFPYIEATGARVNLKVGGEKTPFSLTEADFALWLPEPKHWRLRLEGRPARTDTAVSDTGTIKVEGTLGRATALAGVPMELEAEWSTVPLGSLSLLVLGRDVGLRGEMSLTSSMRGTIGNNQSISRTRFTEVRRADFVPVRPLQAEVSCSARALDMFVSLQDVECDLPLSSTSPRTGAMVRLQGSLPDTHKPASAEGKVTITDVPGSALLDMLHVATARLPYDVGLQGETNGQVARHTGITNGFLTTTGAKLVRNGRLFVDEDVIAHITGPTLVLDKVAIHLGVDEPLLVSGNFDANGSSLLIRGQALPSRLAEWSEAVPQFGDGLSTALFSQDTSNAKIPITINARATRVWGGNQTWTETARMQPGARHRRRSRIRTFRH